VRRREPKALLIDFDGVLHHYDESVKARVEEAAGLPRGFILAAALEPHRVVPAMLGQVSRAGWMTDVAASFADRVGGLDAAEAVIKEWDAYRGLIDPDALVLVTDLRAAGVPVALATNASDDLRDDLAAFGIAHAFDAVVSSAEIGSAKPQREFYAAACAAVGAAPADCLLVDDRPRNVSGARAAGLLAHRYTGPADLRYIRAALKV
jgi:putative hydrolase of the HAD superfamily